jgi:hypothetical protein
LDGTVDVNGDVNLFNRKLSKIPLKFGRVTGNFNCQNNNLTKFTNQLINHLLNETIKRLIQYMINLTVFK